MFEGGIKRASSFEQEPHQTAPWKRQVLNDEYQNKPAEQDWYGKEKEEEVRLFVKASDGRAKQPVKKQPFVPPPKGGEKKPHYNGKFQPMVAKFPPNGSRANGPIAMKSSWNEGKSTNSKGSPSKPMNKKPDLVALAGYPPLAASIRFPSKQGTLFSRLTR
jgi:hypothetical protein